MRRRKLTYEEQFEEFQDLNFDTLLQEMKTENAPEIILELLEMDGFLECFAELMADAYQGKQVDWKYFIHSGLDRMAEEQATIDMEKYEEEVAFALAEAKAEDLAYRRGFL